MCPFQGWTQTENLPIPNQNNEMLESALKSVRNAAGQRAVKVEVGENSFYYLLPPDADRTELDATGIILNIAPAEEPF